MQMTTLCYIEKDRCYLMLHRTKKEKDINKGKWIGVGGHAYDGETPEECLLREVKEETGDFGKERQCEPELMCLFTADGFTGNVCECDEGELMWIDKKKVPELPTWEGDAVFLKLILEDEKRFFTVKLRYQGSKLVENSVNYW